MKAKILSGKEYQKTNFNEIKNEITQIVKKHKKRPGITFICCLGHLPLMKYTLDIHKEASNKLGFKTIIEIFSPKATEQDLFEVVDKHNNNDSVHAIVLFQPVPKHINALSIIERINRKKEVECFHPENIMETLIKGLKGSLYPMCLPIALMELFKISDIKIETGQQFTFVADRDFLSNAFRSLILRTASSLVVPSDCVMTIVDSEHKQLMKICEKADYLIIVSEKPGFFKPKSLKPNMCIVDVYSNLVNEIPHKTNPDMKVPIIKGGVDTDLVKKLPVNFAPCPGGLMPILLPILFKNVLKAFKLNVSIK
ncbi:MAG: hypothetical protein HKO01_07180 [Flaviramulus sp.]|nr:tetrahydrofolate dehydrogenase/cyclohydrolase catalytic domain-containing protein [Flaviramulus sp.]NNC50303.1 hypothetical protein [Flaviramulus sp.]